MTLFAHLTYSTRTFVRGLACGSSGFIDVHQITYDDERIHSAEGIERVWQQFTSWFYREVNTSETVVLVACNGETCDLKWLWNEWLHKWDTTSPIEKGKSCGAI